MRWRDGGLRGGDRARPPYTSGSALDDPALREGLCFLPLRPTLVQQSTYRLRRNREGTMDDLRPIAGARSWWTQLSLRRPQRPAPPRLTFADLARIHHAWRADPDDAALGARYAEALAAF